VSTTVIIGGDLVVGRLGFGAGRITGTGYWGPPPDRDTAVAVLHRAVDAGVTFIDTADNYGPDISEELIASALHPYPDCLVIATKGGVVRTGPGVWHCAGRPEQLRAQCEASLKRLRLDTIPLYQLHRFDPAVPEADQLGTLIQLRDEGKIRHIGLDTITEEQLRDALRTCPIASVQNKFNLYHRADEGVLRLCEQQNIAFLPYLPLAGGTIAASQQPIVERVARTYRATASQVALAWLLHHSLVTVPTPGTKSLKHLTENLGAAALTLGPADMRVLDSVAPALSTDSPDPQRN
jgi:pyridoxine 4-dehydrogenase